MEKRLSRGLDALMGKADAAKPTGQPSILEIPLDRIRTNPNQPRTEFDPDRIRELASSIQQHGLLQPIVVQRSEDGYHLVAGERRFRAVKSLGRATIPAIVRETKLQDRLVVALIENLQRENLNSIEEARAYARLLSEFGLTHEQISERVGKERSTVSNALRLLDLPESIQDAVSRGTISAGHARALLGLKDARLAVSMFEQILEHGLSVRATEERVRAALGEQGKLVPRSKKAKTAGAGSDAFADDIASRIRSHWGVMVDVDLKDRQRGVISFRCGSKAEFDHLVRRLEQASWPVGGSQAFADFEIE